MPSDDAGHEDAARAARRETPLKRVWRRTRQSLAQSRFVRHRIADALFAFMKAVKATNRVVAGSDDPAALAAGDTPYIVALWHGQHLLAPFYMPSHVRAVVLVSRSADAELNALILAKLGIGVVRGSGGRDRLQTVAKGGAKALIALKRALGEGKNVFMIADIPHGVPRESGQGIVKLAQMSGRPILPFAVATSRRKVIAKSWDKTTVNLPFGRVAIIAGDPVTVPADLDDSGVDAFRARVDAALDAATERAYALVDAA